jgi:hypothetical protein
MRTRAYLYARKMVWNQVAQSYMRSFTRAYIHRMQPVYLGFPAQAVEKNVASRLLTV